MYIDCWDYPAVAVAVSFLFFFDFANAADGSWRSFQYYFLSLVLSNLSSRGASDIQTRLFEVFSYVYFLL